MICKKAKKILKGKEEEEEKNQKAYNKMKEEVLFALDNGICPYCGRDNIEESSIVSIILRRWSKRRCPNCKIWFMAAWHFDNYYKFRIMKDKK